MRRYLPALLLALACSAPLMACDLLKSKATDAGADGGVVVVVPEGTTTAVATAVAPTTTGAPLTPGTPTVAPNGQPAVKAADGGAVAVTDAGAKSDAAPTPTPTLPGFDAGAFKGFDAGGLFKGFDAGGFKPPWVK